MDIKRIRTLLNESQTSFAEKIGVKQQTVSGWEKTGKIPKDKIVSICRTYNVRREWLGTGVGEIFEEPAAPTQSPEEFAKASGCDDFTAGIFVRFCRFSDDDKARFSELLKALIADPESVLPQGVAKSGIVVRNQISGVQTFNGDGNTS